MHYSSLAMHQDFVCWPASQNLAGRYLLGALDTQADVSIRVAHHHKGLHMKTMSMVIPVGQLGYACKLNSAACGGDLAFRPHLEARPLACPGLLLDGHDLHHLVLQ